MDVEFEGHPLLIHFDLSQDGFPFRKDIPTTIEGRRALLSDLLLFDILLASGGIRKPDSLYPPTDPRSLSTLLDAISNSSYDRLKKDCLVYYLIKWHEFKIDGSGGDRTREEMFVQERCISPQFVMIADAYWYLDTGADVERAVAILSDARLNKDYASKVLQTITLAEDSPALVIKYIRTARPLLTEPDDLDLYCEALLAGSRIGLWDAWQFQRTFAEGSETKARLVQKIIDWCLMPKPKSAPLKTLLALPLTPAEETLLHAYATTPPPTLAPASLAVLHDLACMRLLQAGKHAAALALDRRLPPAPHAEKRRQMLAEVANITRQPIDDEMDAASAESPTKDIADLSMSMSWQHLPSPRVASIPQRSYAPRFGGTALASPRTAASNMAAAGSPFASPLRRAGPPVTLTMANGTPVGADKGKEREKEKERASLFEARGSAKAARNAFFTPSAKQKEAQMFTNPPPAVPTPPSEDVAMEPQPQPEPEPEPQPAQEVDADMEAEAADEVPSLAASVFGGSRARAEKPPSTRAPRMKRTETEEMMPPGAFITTPAPEPAPEPEPEEEESVSARTRTSARARGKARRESASAGGGTIPGGLDLSTEEEDGDRVAPLRKGRATKGRKGRSTASVVAEEETEEEEGAGRRTTRRSSRLSAASSEPARSTRTAKTGAKTSKRKA